MNTITSKLPLKILNSATFGMKISWVNNMLECYPRIRIDALRPPL